MAGRRRISSGGPWEERVGYSRAVVVGDLAWVSGTTGTRPDGTVPKGVAEQTSLALDIIEGALREAGGSLADVVAARVYLTRIEEWEAVTETTRPRLGIARPAMTLVQVAGLLLPAHRVEIEVEAVIGSSSS